jgi:eukaryotic-like serine/threonine-protein kinase
VSIERLTTALADRYRLERELGQGGMATVYLAEDLKHRRKVAIKVLRPELAAVIGAERFLREIQTIATLQHPHILGLIDSGEVNGTAYYVMPFVEGESLRDRLGREKQLPIGDAVRLAGEVAAALDYAHRHGVIHRDIKPENVMLHDGSALVADFGIALAVSSAGGGARMTETGMSLGTPHYMSPEQAMGERAITARSDVYALGAMTYEMLVGEPPFTGPTAQAIVAKVMTAEPAGLVGQRKSVPPAVEDAVLTALQKLPADRFASAAEFAAALKGDGASTVVTRTTAARGGTPPARRSRTVLALGTVAAIATMAAVLLGLRRERRPAAAVARFTLDIPDLRVNHIGFYGAAIAIARDGSRLVFVARAREKPTHLVVRERGDIQTVPLVGTEGADGPAFSPDGQSIAYIAGGKLFKVSASGGTPVQLADGASVLPSVVWLDDGRIVYSGRDFSVMAVPSAGGTPTTLVPAPASGAQAFFVGLPRTDVLMLIRCGNTCAGPSLVAVNLKTQAVDTILVGAARGYYLPSGVLVAVRTDGSVVGAPFDVGRLRLEAPPTLLLSGVQLELRIVPELAVADDGTMVYLPANATAGLATMAEVDRAGKSRVLDPGWQGQFVSADLSPDGRRIAVATLEGASGGSTLWVKQLDAGPLTRLTFTAGSINYRAAWLPDGRTLTYSSEVGGSGTHIYRIRADGSDKPERLFPNDTAQIDEASWSRDGQWLGYRTGTVPGIRDVYLRRVQGGGAGDTMPIPVAAGQADEYMPAISPDGRWIAYVSLESGREEVYVRPVPDVARARWQVSAAGGTSPVWAHSGSELFYLAQGDTLVAASVRTRPDFQVTGRRALFGTASYVFTPWHQAFGVRPDDRTFVMPQRTAESAGPEARRLVVVLNWFTDVQARLARKE